MPEFLYLDPTAAGLGIQMALGAIVGGLVTVRLFWERIFSVFRRSSRAEDKALTTGEDTLEALEEEAQPQD